MTEPTTREAAPAGQVGDPAFYSAAPTVEVLAPGADDMRRIGAKLAGLLRPGDTVLLGGELGAGKTTLVQGLATALGVGEPVTSPTFVLVHSYKTKLGWDLLHADVWRLENLHEVISLAIPELLDEGGAAVVEWGERAAPALAPDCLHVAISFDAGGCAPHNGPEGGAAMALAGPGGVRRVVFRPLGPSWTSRMAELSASVAA